MSTLTVEHKKARLSDGLHWFVSSQQYGENNVRLWSSVVCNKGGILVV